MTAGESCTLVASTIKLFEGGRVVKLRENTPYLVASHISHLC